MAADKVILKDSKKAGEDLSAFQFGLVQITEENTLIKAVSGSIAYVLDDTPTSGQFGTYDLLGICLVKLAGTVKCGKLVVPNKEGLGVEAEAKAQHVVGQALEEGESGQIIAVFVSANLTA